MNRKAGRQDAGDQDFGFLSSSDSASSASTPQFEAANEANSVPDVTWSEVPAASDSKPWKEPLMEEPINDAVGAVGDVPSTSESRTGRVAASSAVVATSSSPRMSGDLSSSSSGSFALTEKQTRMLLGYAIALTLLMLFCLLSGRLSLTGGHALESLPDLRPLSPNEFRKIPDGTELPDGHVLHLRESRRFGDVVVTPLRVTREPLMFEGFQTNVAAPQLTTESVWKLWLQFENVADDYAFTPFDAGLMSNRTPPDSTDDATIANSFLTLQQADNPTRVLNFLQSMDNNFVISGQHSGQLVRPGESIATFVASSVIADQVERSAGAVVWRVQFRKGVNSTSGNGVTTLVDVRFDAEDVESVTVPADAG